MGKESMRKKILGIFVCMLLITTILPITAMAGDEQNPEITDITGDAFGYIDIKSVWFFENKETPEFLYVSMKINEPKHFVPQQTFAVFWTYNNIEYSVGLGVGFSFVKWESFDVVIYDDQHHDAEIIPINGTYDIDTGIITCEIPKAIIGYPQTGDVLTHTWSNAFRRLGFIGRIGFTRTFLDLIILLVFNNNMWDYAPERGEHGLDYIIQY
jgi:hypothetical protein